MKEKNLKIIDEIIVKINKLNQYKDHIDDSMYLLSKRKISLSKRGKWIIALVLLFILAPLTPDKSNESLYTMYSFIALFVVVVFPIFWAEKLINLLRNKKVEQDLNKVNIEIIERLILLAKDIYQNEYIPDRIVHLEYLIYLRECIYYEKSDTIGKAIVLLEEEIRHQETKGILTRISIENEEIVEQLKNLNNSLLEQVKLISKIQINNTRKSSLTDLIPLASSIVSGIASL